MLGEIASVAGCGTSGVAERNLNHIVQVPKGFPTDVGFQCLAQRHTAAGLHRTRVNSIREAKHHRFGSEACVVEGNQINTLNALRMSRP
jgi:hypothetical protein